MYVDVDINSEVSDLALSYLRDDDNNPDVGPGLSVWLAVTRAVSELARKYDIEDWDGELDIEWIVRDVKNKR